MDSKYSTLILSSVASLSAGTNYCFSGWSPQLAEKLILTSTKTNLIGTAGNLGVYLTGPFVGRIVDKRGPRLVLICGATALAVGYTGLNYIASGGIDGPFSRVGIPSLLCFSALTGMGSACALSASVNSVAKAFSVKRRSTAMGIVMSFFGLSAFFYSNLSLVVPIPFLVLLAIGCGSSILFSAIALPSLPSPSSIVIVSPAAVYQALPEEEERSRDAENAMVIPPVIQHDHTIRVERNVAGFQLFAEVDFYLLFGTLLLLSGIGLMFINNIGEISRALSARAAATPASITSLQSNLVSLLSFFNFLGRLVMGLLSDYLIHHAPDRWRVHKRVDFSLPCATLFLISQVVARKTDSPQRLWISTALTGYSYGTLFGLWPTLVLEYFGLAAFSANNGLISLAPAIGGNISNLIFGLIVDSHTTPPEPLPSILSDSSLLARSSSQFQCDQGKICYAAAFRMTEGMAVGAIVLSLVLMWRSRRVIEDDDKAAEGEEGRRYR